MHVCRKKIRIVNAVSGSECCFPSSSYDSFKTYGLVFSQQLCHMAMRDERSISVPSIARSRIADGRLEFAMNVIKFVRITLVLQWFVKIVFECVTEKIVCTKCMPRCMNQIHTNTIAGQRGFTYTRTYRREQAYRIAQPAASANT